LVSDEVLWLLADHQGTIRDVVDSFGTLRKHAEYDSFGKFCEEPTPYTLGGGQGSQWFFDREGELIADPAASAEAVDQLFYYTGREWDAEAGLYNYRARWYDPAAGRWLSEDPSGFDSGDANLYRYVGNSPLNFTDPTGLRQSGNPLYSLPSVTKPFSNVGYTAPSGADVMLPGINNQVYPTPSGSGCPKPLLWRPRRVHGSIISGARVAGVAETTPDPTPVHRPLHPLRRSPQATTLIGVKGRSPS
jgi:RHS repeat-associated protein